MRACTIRGICYYAYRSDGTTDHEEIASRERADVVNYVLDVGDSQHGELLELHLDHI